MITPVAKFYNPYLSHEEEMAEVQRIVASLQTQLEYRRTMGFWARLRLALIRKIW